MTSGANALQIGYADRCRAQELDAGERPAGSRPASRPAAGRRPASGPEGYADRRRRRSRAPLPVALPRAPFLVLMVALVVVGVLGVLVLNTKINENAFRLDELRRQQAALDLQEQQLNQQLADRSRPATCAPRRPGSGLVPAGTPAFISLPDGRVIGVPQPAPAVADA